MDTFRVELIRRVPSSDGSQADLRLIDPKGYQFEVRCLCRFNGQTEIGTVNSHVYDIFAGKHGHDNVCRECIEVVVAPYL